MKKEETQEKRGIIEIPLYKLILVIIAIISIKSIYNTYYKETKTDDILSDIKVDETQITETDTKTKTKIRTEKMLQLEELKKQNNDIVAWLEIPNTKISYPILQTTDNEYYLTHNYKKEKSGDGSIFLDKDYNWDIPSSNLLIYGHNNKNGNMFQDLLKYEDENYYKEHPTIQFTTVNDDCTYEIIAVFKSRVYYKSEQNVFRYYYFINAENEEEYNNYVEESKKASLYDTGKTAEYGDQLLTLSTCEYSQEDGRFVIVARK